VAFASNYQHLVFFAHSLEVLLHTVLEAGTQSDSDLAAETPASTLSENGVLPLAIEFLDHFDSALDVVVACARKTEMSRWRGLFDIVGNPKTLFEVSYPKDLHITMALKPNMDFFRRAWNRAY
jgi:RAB6A-GEF complex partner protein 1